MQSYPGEATLPFIRIGAALSLAGGIGAAAIIWSTFETTPAVTGLAIGVGLQAVITAAALAGLAATVENSVAIRRSLDGEASGSAAPETGSAVRDCPGCSHANPMSAYRCEECGASLSGTIPRTVGSV